MNPDVRPFIVRFNCIENLSIISHFICINMDANTGFFQTEIRNEKRANGVFKYANTPEEIEHEGA
jgi:predicted hotdog family 3-hydroxylacyl-ACP dehydratase